MDGCVATHEGLDISEPSVKIDAKAAQLFTLVSIKLKRR